MPETMEGLKASIEKIVRSRFPESYLGMTLSTLGGPSQPSLGAHFALGKDKDAWPSHIIHNDPGHTVFLVHTKADEQGNINNLELTSNIHGYMDKKTYKSDKANWRDIKKPTNIAGIEKNLIKYFDRMKEIHVEQTRHLEPPPQPEPEQKTYIWENCRTPGVQVVGIGTSRQEAFSRLTPDNRNLVTFADSWKEYPNNTKMFRHNMVFQRQGMENHIILEGEQETLQPQPTEQITPEQLANKYVTVNMIDKRTLLATIEEYPDTPLKSERLASIYAYLSREEANILGNFSNQHDEFYITLMVVDKNLPLDKQVPRDIKDISREIQTNTHQPSSRERNMQVLSSNQNENQFSDIEDVIKSYGLKLTVDYILKQHGIPEYAQNDTDAFTDFCRQAQYGGMKLDEKVVEWANQGEIQHNEIKLDAAFFEEAFTDPETNRPYHIPGNIRQLSERLCKDNNIKGTSDPMYIVNVTAYELGLGDGQSNFVPVRSTTEENLDRLTNRINSAYRNNIIDPSNTRAEVYRLCKPFVMSPEEIRATTELKYIVETYPDKENYRGGPPENRPKVTYGFYDKTDIETFFKERRRQGNWSGYSISENTLQDKRTTRQMMEYYLKEADINSQAAFKEESKGDMCDMYQLRLYNNESKKNTLLADKMEALLPEATPAYWDNKGNIIISDNKQESIMIDKTQPATTSDLMTQLVKAGIKPEQMGNHKSDLYVEVNDISKAIIKDYQFKQNVTTFRSNIDGKLNYEIPFAYTPAWDKSQRADTEKTFPGLPHHCYSKNEETSESILLIRGESGYKPAPYIADVAAHNKSLGVIPSQEEAMKVGSMFGWNVPGADPKVHSQLDPPKPPPVVRKPELERGTPHLGITRHNVGDKVSITLENMQVIINSSCSIKVYPSDNYIKKCREIYEAKTEGVITHTFPPGYEVTAKFGEQSFHMKDNFVTNLTQTQSVGEENFSTIEECSSRQLTQQEKESAKSMVHYPGALIPIPSPLFPNLTPTEAKELNDFTTVVKTSYPETKPETLHQLCTIASDMQKLTIQNEKGTLSNEKFNTLTDNLEKQVENLIKDFPGVQAQYHYATETRVIILHIPNGSNYATCTVPEIPKNKLTLPPEPKAAPDLSAAKKR